MLEIKDLVVYYDKALALDHVDIGVGENEIVAVLGANGAGKTTLLRTISGLVRGKGEIKFDNVEIGGYPPHKIVGLGVVHCPEGRRLFPEMSVLDNMLLGAYLRKDRSGLEADCNKIYDIFPILRERSGQVAGTLSGGEQMMLATGRAMMAKPKLLMMDEPSLGLAPIAQESIFRGIRAISQMGVSILLVEQNAQNALAIASRAYVLEAGRAVVSGASGDLARDPRVKAAYLAA